VLEVGFGSAVITPSAQHWPIWLSGYGDRRDPAADVHDDLEVRVMVARSGSSMCALVVLDLMAMSNDWADAVRGGVAVALDLPVEHVLTQTVHTHSAPSTITGTDALGWTVPHSWRAELVERCCVAADRALEALRPARLAFVRLALPAALSFNRRGHAYAPSYCVVDVLDAEVEARLGTIANIGAHPVVLGPQNLRVSADWVGVCRREMERRLGGRALFVQGCQGDVDPQGMTWTSDSDAAFAAVERVGEDMALAVVAAAAVANPVPGDEVQVATRSLKLDCSGSPMAAITRRDTVDVDLFDYSIGGVRFVSIPGEGFAELGTRVVASRAPTPTVLFGFAPHWLGYLPVPYTDGYEEGLSYGEATVDAIARALEIVAS
jgi:hypothetical protein